MSKIQTKLDSLQPYVVGIRYVQGIAFIDVVFKVGWSVPESTIIQRHINEENVNHYIFFSERDGIGVDELLDFAEKIIELNIEREKKKDLLGKKFKELQKVFIDNPLDKLQQLRFVLTSEASMPEIMNTDIFNDMPEPEQGLIDLKEENEVEEPQVAQPINPKPGIAERYPNKEPEIKEVIEAEDITPKGPPMTQKTHNKPPVELPPKGKIELEVHDLPPEMTQGECNCAPDQYCPKCMDEKGF